KCEGGNVIDLKKRSSQTMLFHSFVKLVNGSEETVENSSTLKIRVQDLSATGMSLHLGELETKYFTKDKIFKNVQIDFSDEQIMIPEVKIEYDVDHTSRDQNLKSFKVGLSFPNLSDK